MVEDGWWWMVEVRKMGSLFVVVVLAIIHMRNQALPKWDNWAARSGC